MTQFAARIEDQRRNFRDDPLLAGIRYAGPETESEPTTERV